MVIRSPKPEKNFYDDKETISRELREEILFKDFSKKLTHITSLAKGWKRILEDVNINEIRQREDLKRIPITRKSDLTNIQSLQPPFGGLAIKNANYFPYIFASPGPINEPGDHGDFWNMSRSLFAAGLRSQELVYNTFSYHLGPAGIMMGSAANNLGCSVIAGGIGSTELQVSTINALLPNFYIGTPSFLKLLIEKSLEKKIDISSINRGLVGAEPLPPSFRNFFSEKGISVIQMYGSAEVGCIAYETKDPENEIIPGMIIEENIILEIVRPGTTESLPVGEVGEVVITKLDCNYPMIRLATGDLSVIINEVSPCGRTNLRIKGWMGRAEQSTKIKGLFITPMQLNLVLDKFKEIRKVKLLITNESMVDKSILFCETQTSPEDLELKSKIKEFLKETTKLNINISLVNREEITNDGMVIEDKRTYE